MSQQSPPPQHLGDPACLAFPFRVGPERPAVSRRGDHVRSQIEQVLFTSPGERVFRPEFGAGIRALVFEPNATAIWEITRRRILSSLADALKGEVDPRSLEVEVSGSEEQLLIVVRYKLATIGVTRSQRFLVGGKDG